jgi:hypothetical protein
MSRVLPEHPNLEHLRKQAKQRLLELQKQNPESKLADAQHAIAREYGFASWPRLKVHVESIARWMAPRTTGVHPLAGTWTANLAKSKRHPGNQFRSAMLQFTVNGNEVTITDVVVDDSGREERSSHTLTVDGTEHRSSERPAYGVKASWLGPRLLETMGTREGVVIGQGRYQVSEDGMTLIVSDGGGEQVVVLDRS